MESPLSLGRAGRLASIGQFVSLSGGLLPVFSIGLTAALALATPAPVPSTGSDVVPIRVEFDAPAGCSSADAFYTGLLTRMNRARRAAAGENAVRLGVHLTRVGTRVRGELRMMDGPGDGDTRRVEGESCEAVVEVLSLTAALALVTQAPRATPPPPPPPPRVPPRASSNGATSTPSETTKAPETPPANETLKPPEPPKPPEADKPVIVNPPPPPPPPEHVGTRFLIGLQAVAANVITNSTNVGGGLGLRLERHADDHPRASIGLTFVYAQNDLLQSPQEISLRWAGLALTGCPPLSLGRILTLQACVQGIGGWLTATGRGISNPSTVVRSWWSVGAFLRAGAHFGGGFALELEAGATLPLVERSFYLDTMDRTVGRTPTIAPVIALGLSRAL